MQKNNVLSIVVKHCMVFFFIRPEFANESSFKFLTLKKLMHNLAGGRQYRWQNTKTLYERRYRTTEPVGSSSAWDVLPRHQKATSDWCDLVHQQTLCCLEDDPASHLPPPRLCLGWTWTWLAVTSSSSGQFLFLAVYPVSVGHAPAVDVVPVPAVSHGLVVLSLQHVMLAITVLCRTSTFVCLWRFLTRWTRVPHEFQYIADVVGFNNNKISFIIHLTSW